MAQRGNNIVPIASLLLVSLLAVMAHPSAAAELHRLENGINVTVHSPEEIRSELLTVDKSGAVLVHPSAGSVRLAAPDRPLFPFDADVVVTALADMAGFRTDVDVEVFILDAIPADVGSSFARRGAIYLAPGIGPVAPETVSYITSHEMGHVLTWAFLDDLPGRWTTYLNLRGLDAVDPTETIAHADRPREILAEDIRFLFGGSLAIASGSIENPRLKLPVFVPELRETLATFFTGRDEIVQAISATAFPNPCNPRTTVEMQLPVGVLVDGAEASLNIYDVRGARVSSLQGGYVANDRVAINWDGTNDAGQAAPSGRYLYVMQVGGSAARGAVTLVR